MRKPLCIRIVLLVTGVLSCQPPLPAFHAPAAPMGPQLMQQVDSAAHFGMAPVSGVASHQSSNSLSAPTLSNSIDQELTPFDSRVESTNSITPYPGYIPPPPAPNGNFPTLIQSDEHLSRAPVNPRLNGNQLGFAPVTCKDSFGNVADLISCLRFLPMVPRDDSKTSCDFEKPGVGCRFQPTTSTWQLAQFSTPAQYLAVTTLSKRNELNPPKGAFIAMIGQVPQPPSQEMALATTITCQKGNGNLTFDYWIAGDTENVKLVVCTQDSLIRSCTKSIAYRESSTVSAEVVKPNATIFELEIVISNVVQPTVVIVDNIDYRANLCEQSGGIDFTPSPSDVQNFFQDGEVDTTTDPEMQTEEQNDEPQDPEVIGTIEQVPLENDHDQIAIPARPILPEADFRSIEEGFVATQSRGVEVLPKSRGADYDDGPVGPPGVQPTLENDSDGPPGAEPSEDSEFTTEAPQHSRATLAIRKITTCSLLNCTFDGTFCGYNNYKNETYRTSDWNLGKDKIGNPHTGIRKEEINSSGFLYVGTDSGAHTVTTYILESPVLKLNEDILLSFDVYRRSNDITLQVCLNSPFYCPYKISAFEKDVFWKEGESFAVAKGTSKIYLKAIQWRKFKWLAIDNIRVSSGENCD